MGYAKGKNRKYSNELVAKIAQSVKIYGYSETAKIYDMKYEQVHYCESEYHRRKQDGEKFPSLSTLRPNKTTTDQRVYLKPRVPIYSTVEDGWKDLETKLDDRQLDVVHKFYNTVLFQTSSFDTKFMIYEQD